MVIIFTNNVVNRSIGENRYNESNFLNNECANIYETWYRLYDFLLGGRDADNIDISYKKEWDILFMNQIISGDYLKNPILGTIYDSLILKIMLRVSTRHGLLFQRYKRKLIRSVNTENTVRQTINGQYF
jgi:uncharacterized protein (DUF2062 family)